MRTLFLSASFGGGHLQANRALHEALGGEALERDYLEYIPLWQRLPVVGVYHFSLRYWPGLYRWFYRVTDTPKEPRVITAQFDRAGFAALRTDVLSFEPEVVISSFPTATALVGSVRRELGADFKSVLVVTDFRAHRHWAQLSADLVFVPSEEAAADLVRFGLPRERVLLSGIPLRREVVAGADPEEVRRAFGFDERPLVLIASGATDAYRAEGEAVRAVAALGVPAQVVRFRPGARRERREEGVVTVHTLPAGPDFARVLAAADLVLGKAGGVTVAEALALGKPYLVYKPIPGHEERNALWLEEKGAGRFARTRGELHSLLSAWLKDPLLAAAYGERARALGRPRAAWEVAERIRALLGG